MPEPGQYQGKRLSATEVTRLYAAGERDFRGAVLCGCNFRGVDLSGADFSGADIRSARFVEATLRGVNFNHAKAGLQRRWWIGQMLLQVILAVLAGTFQGVAGGLIGGILGNANLSFRLPGVLGVVTVGGVLIAIAYQGFTLQALGRVSFAFATAFIIAFPAAISIFGISTGTILTTGTIAIAIAIAIVGVFSVAVTGAFSNGGSGTIVSVLAFLVALFVAAAVADTTLSASSLGGAISGAAGLATVSSGVSGYVEKQVKRNDLKFENLRVMGLTFAALGGTIFSGANLAGSIFSHTILKSTNFAKSRQKYTILTNVRWHHAQKLNLARLGTTNLQDHRVRLLLTTLNGIDQDLSNADLRGANLAGARVHRANLTGANLSGATLHHAELQGAILTAANCVGTDFNATQLTGACLEAWNIDETTILQDIDCKYVFLREQPDARGDRERRPHNPNKEFQSGDFEKFFKDMQDTVQLLIRNGVNPDSFKATLQSFIEAHPNMTADSIQGVERRGNDVLLSIQVPEGTDKGDFERRIDEVEKARLQAATANAQLEAERRRADDFKEVHLTTVNSFSKLFSNLTTLNLTANSTAMNHSNNPNVSTGDGSFYAGGDVNLSGSTLNLGQISGQVTNQINQLPAPAAPDQPSLRDILTQLQTAAETDGELSDDEKAEALQAVSRIAAAATDPAPSAKTQGVVKRAAATLKGMTETLTDASKLADACTTLLPLVLSLFALI